MTRLILAALATAASACASQTLLVAFRAPTPLAKITGNCTRVAWQEPGKPIVRASLNGRELTFLVDTGAEFDGWIKPEVAKSLGLPVVGQVPTEEDDDGTGGLPFYGIERLDLGSMRFEDVRFAEQPQRGPKPLPFDGIIGNHLFARLQAVFDYQRGALLVTRSRLTRGSQVQFDKYGIPVVTLGIGAQEVEANLDTGNMAGGLMVTAAAAKTLAFASEPVKEGSAMTVSGKFDVMEAKLAAPVRFAATPLAIDAVRFPGAYDMGQLGSKGLAGQTVRIDWRSRRISISPEASAPSCR